MNLCGAFDGALLYCTRAMGHSGRHIATVGPYTPEAEALGTWSPTDPCIVCPQQVRALYAVAFNLLNLRDDPDRWHRKIAERLDELTAAVHLLTPFIDAHFKDEDHSHSPALEAARSMASPHAADAVREDVDPPVVPLRAK